MIGWNKIGHFKNQVILGSFLIHALEVNSLYTNTPQPHTMHINSKDWPTQEFNNRCNFENMLDKG